MKPIIASKRKSLAYGIAAVLLGTASIAFAAGADGDAIVHSAGGVSYVSGGVGTESADRLASLAGDFNLKLVFAMKSGAYVTGVRVGIADAAGKTLVDAMSDGPWFMARLPAGDYRVVATFAGNAVKRQIAIGTVKLETIDFRWGTE
jgi:hypothetical protein